MQDGNEFGSGVALVLEALARVCFVVAVSALVILPASDVEVPWLTLLGLATIGVTLYALSRRTRRRVTMPLQTGSAGVLHRKAIRRLQHGAPRTSLSQMLEHHRERKRRHRAARRGPQWMTPHLTRRRGPIR